MNLLLSHFMTTGSSDDLKRATTWYEEAVKMYTTGLPQDLEYHNVVSAHSKVLRIRYEVLREVGSVARALTQQRQLAKDVPAVHANRANILCGLVQTLVCMAPSQKDIEEALLHLLDALGNNYCWAYRKLKHVLDLLTYLAKHFPLLNHDNALQLSVVYSTAISLLPQVASFGLDPRARLAVISSSGQLTARGASHAISVGPHELALEMLKAGGSVFQTQGLRLRTSFTNTNLPPAISDRLMNLTSALRQPMADFGGEQSAKDRELSRRRRLGDEFAVVLAEARLLPGFQGLLQNPTFAPLAQAARRHPIVVLSPGIRWHAQSSCTKTRCVQWLLSTGSPKRP